MAPAAERGLSRVEWLCGIAGVAVVACWARITALPQVFVAGQVLPAFPDVHYHVHRIWMTLQVFPRVPVMDPYLNWPDGGPCPWPPGFDWLGAVFVALLGGATDPEAAARVAAFFPIAIGTLVVLATALLARVLSPAGFAGDCTALAAGLIAAVLPQAVIVSQVGSVDHHVAEALAMVLLGGWVLRAAARPQLTRGDRLRFELRGAAIVSFAGLVFNGSILYVAVAFGLLIALRLSERGGRETPLWLGSGALAALLGACVIALANRAAIAEHGFAIDFRFPSYLQPMLHVVVAVGCLGAGVVARTVAGGCGTGERLARRAAVLSGAIAVFVGLAGFVAAAASAELISGVTQWLWRSDPWLAGINEFQPLFSSFALWQPETWRTAIEVHGYAAVATLVCVPVGAICAIRHDARSGACFAGVTLALVALTLIQNRFGRVLTSYLAIALALTLAEGLRWAWRRMSPALASTSEAISIGRLHRAMAALAVLALVLAIDPAIRRGLLWQSSRQPTAVESASLFLRGLRANPEQGTGAPGSVGGGVLTKWDYGHTVLRIGRRPVVAAGFGPWPGEEGFREVGRALHGSEPELMELMERRRLDYLLTGATAFLSSSHTADPSVPPLFLVDVSSGSVEPNPAFFRSRPLASLILGGGGIPAAGIPHAPHLFPRFVSPQRLGPQHVPIFQSWVYQRVPGVELRGRVAPGARVIARTDVLLHGQSRPYQAWTDAGPDGRFRLVVALPSAHRAGGLESAPEYEVRSGDTLLGRLALTEAMVRGGSVIEL